MLCLVLHWFLLLVVVGVVFDCLFVARGLILEFALFWLLCFGLGVACCGFWLVLALVVGCVYG